MISILIVCLAGIMVQSTATCWVLSVDRGYVVLSTISSMMYATAMLLGVTSSLNHLAHAISYVIGCGLGSLLVVAWSVRRRRKAFLSGNTVLIPERRKNARLSP